MPYSKERYGTKEQYRKYRRCLKDVKKKQGSAVNEYAVCQSSIYKRKKKK